MNLKKLKQLDSVCQTSKLATTSKQIDNNMNKIAKLISPKNDVNYGINKINSLAQNDTKSPGETAINHKLYTKTSAKKDINKSIKFNKSSSAELQSKSTKGMNHFDKYQHFNGIAFHEKSLDNEIYQRNRLSHMKRKFYEPNLKGSSFVVPLSFTSLNKYARTIRNNYIKPSLRRIRNHYQKITNQYHKAHNQLYKVNSMFHSFNQSTISSSNTYRGTNNQKPLKHASFGNNGHSNGINRGLSSEPTR